MRQAAHLHRCTDELSVDSKAMIVIPHISSTSMSIASIFLLVDDEQSLTRTGRNINDNNAEVAEMATQRTNLT